MGTGTYCTKNSDKVAQGPCEQGWRIAAPFDHEEMYPEEEEQLWKYAHLANMFLSIRFLPSQLLCCSEYSRLPKTRYSFCFIYVVGGTVSIMFPPVCRQNKWRITSAEHCQHSYLADLRWWGERPDIWFGN